MESSALRASQDLGPAVQDPEGAARAWAQLGAQQPVSGTDDVQAVTPRLPSGQSRPSALLSVLRSPCQDGHLPDETRRHLSSGGRRTRRTLPASH